MQILLLDSQTITSWLRYICGATTSSKRPLVQNTKTFPVKAYIQSNPVNTDPEGAIQSVRIKRVMLSKSKRHLLLVQVHTQKSLIYIFLNQIHSLLN